LARCAEKWNWQLRDRPDGFPGTFGDYTNDIYLTGKVAVLSQCTRNQYASLLRLHVIPFIGKLPLREIRPLDCLQIIEMNKPHYAQGTLCSIRNAASGVFTDAVCRGYLATNPIQLIHVQPSRRPKKVQFTPLVDQAVTLRKVLEHPCYEMITLSCCTSIHYGELTALRWRFVNLTGQTVRFMDPDDGDVRLEPYTARVRKSYYRGEYGDCKNQGRHRTAVLPTQVVAALSALRECSQFGGPDDLVFCDDGKPLDEDSTRRELVAGCEKAGVPRLGFHSFRRYFATQAKAKKMDPDDIRRAMGRAGGMTYQYTAEDLDRRRPFVQAIADDLFEEAK
jgi:integrase